MVMKIALCVMIIINKNIFLGSDQLSILMKNSRYVHVYFFVVDIFCLGFAYPFSNLIEILWILEIWNGKIRSSR